MKRWAWSLEGTRCHCCQGRGRVEEARDAHRTAGIIPCPLGTFQGHGYPTCHEGVLKFSQYDRDNEAHLRGGRPSKKIVRAEECM